MALTTTPDSLTYPVQGYGLLAPLPAYVINVQDVPGADPTGNDDSTLAIQTALDSIPEAGGEVLIVGQYKISATLYAKSNTTISGTGTIKSVDLADWRGSRFRCISNENWEASTITDENITIRGVTLDWTGVGVAGGLGHVIYIRRAQCVRVENVTILSGASACALLGCDDTLVTGCRMIGFRNCGADHWDRPTNARVIGNYLETAISSQMVNFNPEPSSGTVTGYAASGFVMANNILVSTENPATPCQIEPLATGNYVENVTIAGNRMKNCYLVLRGDVRGAAIYGNTFSDFQGTGEAITGYSQFGVLPSGVQVFGNTIRDPLTALANVAVIRMNGTSCSIFGNNIIGTNYTAAPFSVQTSDGQIFGNYAATGPTNGKMQSGFRLLNGADSYLGWLDTSGTVARFFMQADNNWILSSTDASGAARNVFSISARSSSSELRFSVPILFNGSYTRRTPATVAAAGTTISGATALTADINNVTTCTAGVADGVALFPVDGQLQTVINTSAATLKVYPNNSGSAQIDNGGASVPTTILAGKAKTFTRVAAGDFRTVSAT